MFLLRRAVRPVELGADEAVGVDGHLDVLVVARRVAGLEQEDAQVRLLRQPAGEHGA